MNKIKILHICCNGSWVHPLLHELETRAEVMSIFPSGHRNTDVRMTNEIADAYRDKIESFHPDIIHVHGTEKNYGQLQHFYPDIPVVVSIQGILTGYIPHTTCGLTRRDVLPFSTLKNLLNRGGLMEIYRRATFGSKAFEEDILASCRFFFCRTDWDREWVMKYNPKAVIYQGEELLRPTFYSNSGQWNIHEAERHSIFMPSGFNPIKGLHHAIVAVSRLKEKYPDVSLHVPGIPSNIYNRKGVAYRLIGEEYMGYIRHLIETLHVEKHIVFLPYLSAEEMAQEMLRAHVFLSPSSIDNSPNAVGEAMMLGLPIVSTPVGGVPSFVHHEQNGLLADHDHLAAAIDRLFCDEGLSCHLSEQAHATALLRHNKEKTAEQYLSAYNDILKRK